MGSTVSAIYFTDDTLIATNVGDSPIYLKAEYRHFFSDFIDVNTAAVGVGFKF